MSGDVVAGVGLVIAAGAVAVAVLAEPSRLRSAAMAVALVLAGVLILGDGWHRPQIAALRESPPKILLVILLGSAALAIGLALVRRRPALLPLAILFAVPFRVPLGTGSDQANLLAPLYLVIVVGVLAAVLRDRGHGPPLRDAIASSTWLRRALAVFAVVYILGVLYSEDFSKGLQNAGFFIIPFSLAYVLLADQRWDSRLLRNALYVVVAEALLFAVVGFVEYSTRSLIWNEAVIRSNDFHVYFRVNSLFWDPNVFGRFLALVIVTVTAAFLRSRERRWAFAAVAAIAILMAALTTTFSQSSLAAVLAGMVVLAALRWSARLTVIVGVAGAVLAVGAGFATGVLDRPNIDTGGRANLVSGGIRLYRDRPVAGYGSGSFPEAYQAHANEGKDLVSESHTEPVTVAAEQGSIGLLAYLALLGAAVVALTRGMRGVMPGLGGRFAAEGAVGEPDGDGGTELVARAAILAAFIALLVHTMTYAGFIEDPITWCLLAIGGSLAATRDA